MAKAIFSQEFNYSSRKRNAGWSVKPSAKAQYFPRELVDAAVKAGCAVEVVPRNRKKESTTGVV